MVQAGIVDVEVLARGPARSQPCIVSSSIPTTALSCASISTPPADTRPCQAESTRQARARSSSWSGIATRQSSTRSSGGRACLARVVGEDRRELVDLREQVGHRPIGTGGGVVELVVTYAGYLSAHLLRRRAEVEHGESRSGGPFTDIDRWPLARSSVTPDPCADAVPQTDPLGNAIDHGP